MRFIVDESTGMSVVSYLRGQGHDVLAVAEGMPQADDADILARAAGEGRILITNLRPGSDGKPRPGARPAAHTPHFRSKQGLRAHVPLSVRGGDRGGANLSQLC